MSFLLRVCFFLLILPIRLYSQEYDVISFSINSTPINGVKIKTNIPYTSSSQMVTLDLKGYNYISSSSIGLIINYYIFNGNFINHSISSYGGYVPKVSLSNEGGKVVVFINDKAYYQRFRVKAFARGMQEQASWFQGWVIADEALAGSNTVHLSYKNRMGDLHTENIYLTGKIGIGTATPNEKLAVNGNIRAKEIKVEAANWPDYVFKQDYELMSLKEVEQHIQQHGHLPDVPKAEQIEKEGLSVSEMNKLMMKKIEELTLHLIEKDKQVLQLQQQLKRLDEKISEK